MTNPSPQTFRDELAALINRRSLENGSDTPDFILADYLIDCLLLFDRATRARSAWYGQPGDRHKATADAALVEIVLLNAKSWNLDAQCGPAVAAAIRDCLAARSKPTP